MEQTYIILNIITIPLNIENYLKKTEEEKQKLINPIDSKIIAIGIRYKEKNIIFSNRDEKEILQQFWEEWRNIKKEKALIPTIGFNIKNFDIPFLVTRSFINNVKISPFYLKDIIDIRDKIQAYRPGKTRGKLKEYGVLLGAQIANIDIENIPLFYINKNQEKIQKCLEEELELIEILYKRAIETEIMKINKY